MQYHALALAVNEGDVDLVGLEGAPVHAALTAEPRLHSHRLPDRSFRSRVSGGRRRFVWMSAARAAMQAGAPADDVDAAAEARRHRRAKPAGRADACCGVAGRAPARRALRHRLAQPVPRHSRRAAGRSPSRRPLPGTRANGAGARRADAHLAVSSALAEWLRREWGIKAVVLYDRPPTFFAKPRSKSANELWQRLARDLNLGTRRMPIVVCPTSWTPDEDFDLLLEALERAERDVARVSEGGDGRSPDLAVLLTGRGHLRERLRASSGAARLAARGGADGLARAERLSHARRHGRRRSLPAPVGIRTRLADEARGFSWRRRPGVRLRLRAGPVRSAHARAMKA